MKQVTTNDFRKVLEELGEELRQRIELECEAFPIDDAAREDRRAKVFDRDKGFAFFRKHYFPHYHEKPDSLFHEELEDRLPAIVNSEKGRKEAIVAGRGSAKSTCCSLEFPIWCVLLQIKRFPVIASDASDQAELLLDALKAEIEVNPRLKYDFPELAPGRIWRNDEIILNKCRIAAIGSGKKIRGRRHGPYRVDLFIGDDLENDENVQSPEQRDKLENWIDKAVLKSGPTDGTLDALLIGTVLHFDSVLARKAAKPGWNVTRFDALLTFPDRMDLWEVFAELVQNSDDDEFVEANAFYAINKSAMDQGGKCTWPDMQPLLLLMTEWAEDENTFMSERQNEPVSKNALFSEVFYWVQRQTNLLTFGAIDPSLGKNGKGRDPSAIIIVGVDPQTKKVDVLSASIRKRLPDVIISDAIAMQQEHGCALWFVEAVQFQEFLRTELMKAAVAAGVPLPAMPITPTADKRLRIERLQPLVSAGLIRFHASQKVLLSQLQQFPNAANDDGPDCLEMAAFNAIQHAGGLDGSNLKSAPSLLGGGGTASKGYRL